MEVILIVVVISIISKLFGPLKKLAEEKGLFDDPYEDNTAEDVVPPLHYPYGEQHEAPQPTAQPYSSAEQPTGRHRKNASSAARPTSPPPAPPIAAEPEAESEYAIRSAEEARRAIIWGEILQRKY